jgi:error-prone DNA polymerase
MGFYQPAQLVRDAREHGVEVLPPDVLASDWDCTLEPPKATPPRVRDDRLFNPETRPHWKAVRLGLRQIKGVTDNVDWPLLAKARDEGARTPEDFAHSGVSQRALELLAEADAFASTGLSRREALWAVKGLKGEHRAPVQAPLLAGCRCSRRRWPCRAWPCPRPWPRTIAPPACR